jgi:oligoribonuclease
MVEITDWPTKLLWIDLEMTGLDPDHDVILEVAAEVTDFDFKTLASYEACVKHDRDLVVKRMQKSADWWMTVPDNRDEFLKKLNDQKPSKTVEDELISFVENNFGSELAIIAGNSIHNDRNFIKHWWPAFDLKLHYRMLDVSSLKIVMQGKYRTEYKKNNVHRAFDDIQASIAELQYYLEWLKKK